MAASWVVFHLTDRCQLNCRHCLRDPGQTPLDLPLDIVETALDQARRLHATDHVGLTGGEPTLHPRFAEVLEAIVARGMTWHLVTNASRFERLTDLLEARPHLRAALTAVDLSLDGADEATHDRVRGPGSFRAVMAAAVRCSALGLPFVVQMTVNALNAEQLEAMGLLASQLGARRLSVGMTQATGHVHDAELRLAPAQWRQLHDRVLRLGETLRLAVTASEGFRRAQPFHLCEAWRQEILHVDVRGRLTLCCALSGVPGDGEPEVLADLASETLAAGHRRFIDAVHRLQRERLDALERGGLEEWDLFPCNWCLRRHGKPHWTADGSAGPRAASARSS